MSTAESVATSMNRVTLIVLGRSYAHMGYKADSKAHNSVTAILHDVSNGSAWDVSRALWDAFPGKNASSRATCNLFYALGRTDALGHVAEEAGNYDADAYNSFLSTLSPGDREAINAYTP